jgi:ribosomal protein S18 acetylase RimI-like enzyme
MAVEIRPYRDADLPGVIALCAAEGWPSFVDDPDLARRAFTAPGVTTVVAEEAGEVVGFAELMSDGVLQAHLSLIATAASHRRRGIARTMLELALDEAGGARIDLVTDSADAFYSRLPHRRMSGFRLYPPFAKRDP